jgi:hypothetical protein
MYYYGRPEKLDSVEAIGTILENETRKPREVLREILGADQAARQIVCGKWKLPMVIDADRLGGHLEKEQDKGRVKYLGLLEDVLRPQELWAQFMKKPNGKVVLRWRMINSVEVVDSGKKIKLLLVCEGNSDGVMEAITFYPVSKDKDINRYRIGRLVAHTAKVSGRAT